MNNFHFLNTSRELAVVTTITPWHEPPRIRHQVTRQLTRFYNVLYIQLPFGSKSKCDKFEKVDENLITFTPKKLARGLGRLWINFPSFHHICNKFLVDKIEASVEKCGYKNAILVNFQFNFPEVMSSNIFSPKIYICNDEFTNTFPNIMRKKKQLLERYETETLLGSNFCFAVSEPLVRKLKQRKTEVLLLLPGHEFTINGYSDDVLEKRNDRLIEVCFMGYINNRIQFDWLEEALKDDRINLNLIGPVQNHEALNRLSQYKNFKYHKPLSKSDLQSYLQSKDVFIMPYDASQADVKASSAPNKLFQYLACGKPIVISDMPNFIKLPDYFIYRAMSAKDFVCKIHRAFEEDSIEIRKARFDYAAANTWDIRGDFIRSFLTKL